MGRHFLDLLQEHGLYVAVIAFLQMAAGDPLILLGLTAITIGAWMSYTARKAQSPNEVQIDTMFGKFSAKGGVGTVMAIAGAMIVGHALLYRDVRDPAEDKGRLTSSAPGIPSLAAVTACIAAEKETGAPLDSCLAKSKQK